MDSESTMAEAVKMADVVDDTEDFPDYEDDSSECGYYYGVMVLLSCRLQLS